jgi:ribosomal protein S18 acetylase RimI-like enzyme
MKKQVRKVKFDLSQVTLRLASIEDKEILTRMLNCFAKDLWSQYKEMLSFAEYGNVCDEKLEHTIMQMLRDKELFIAHADNENLGFVVVSSPEFQEKYINLAYVRPSARGKGVGSKLYELAMREHGATAIELMYRRVHKNVNYWRKAGFRSIKFKGSSDCAYGSIVRLFTQHSPSIMCCELDTKKIWAFRKRLHKSQMQITKVVETRKQPALLATNQAAIYTKILHAYQKAAP